VRVRADLTGLCFSDVAFDLVVCNHVLEHIPDDRVAMRELLRVMRPGGLAVLQVPIGLSLAASREDAKVVSEEERLHHFGQADHVRIYCASDYVARLQRAGFAVEQFRFAEKFGAEQARFHGVDPRETLFAARRPA
jgi:ubiquinone/menaquinone biosynthesis C-methylase UbiE